MDETSDQNLHLNTIHYEGGVFGYIPQTDIVNSINWNNGNIAHITVGASNRFLSFTAPTNTSRLMLMVYHTGAGVICWPDIDGQMAIAKLSTMDGYEDLITLQYNPDTDRYYGIVSYSFADGFF